MKSLSFLALPFLALLFLATVGALLSGCAAKEGAPAGGPGAGGKGRGAAAFPVEVRAVESRRVEYSVNAVGAIEAFERVMITARIAGVVDRVLFQEGDTVQAGHALVEIEPERYKVAVRSARASLEKALAQKSDAQTGLTRREKANTDSPGLVREDELDTYRGRRQISAADEALARAALERAELDVRDAYVRASMAGVIETRNVQTGQYVQPGTVLATLLRREPLLLRFQVPAQEAAGLRPRMKATFQVRGALRAMTATITHVADAADPGSRLVPVTARIDDPERRQLRPGGFAEVTVPIGAAEEASVIPQTAVHPSERGFLAYTVVDEKAKEHVVTLGLRTQDGLVEVREGLTPGELLVVRGAEALKDGAAVRVSRNSAEASPARGRERPPALVVPEAGGPR